MCLLAGGCNSGLENRGTFNYQTQQFGGEPSPPGHVPFDSIVRGTGLLSHQIDDLWARATTERSPIQSRLELYRTVWFHPDLSPGACHIELRYAIIAEPRTIAIRGHNSAWMRRDGARPATARLFVHGRPATVGSRWNVDVIPGGTADSGIAVTRGDAIAIIQMNSEPMQPPRDEWHYALAQPVAIEDLAAQGPIDFAFLKGNGYRGDATRLHAVWAKARNTRQPHYTQVDGSSAVPAANWDSLRQGAIDVQLVEAIATLAREQIRAMPLGREMRDLCDAALSRMNIDGFRRVPWFYDHRPLTERDLVYLLQFAGWESNAPRVGQRQ